MPVFNQPEIFEKQKSVAVAKVDLDEIEQMYAKLNASLESLGFIKNLINDLLYMDLQYIGDRGALALLDGIKMRTSFIREAVSLLGPSLDAIEEYLSLKASSVTEDKSE
jgi:hypothetical protein